jgi:hypothetical protein
MRGFSSPGTSPAAFFSSLRAFLLATTAALSLSAYSHPEGDKSESALYECSMSDWPDYTFISDSSNGVTKIELTLAK